MKPALLVPCLILSHSVVYALNVQNFLTGEREKDNNRSICLCWLNIFILCSCFLWAYFNVTMRVLGMHLESQFQYWGFELCSILSIALSGHIYSFDFVTKWEIQSRFRVTIDWAENVFEINAQRKFRDQWIGSIFISFLDEWQSLLRWTFWTTILY